MNQNQPSQEMELPLRVGPQIEDGIPLRSIRDSGGIRIAREVLAPHAARIVLCVNSHDALLEACKQAESALAAFLRHHPAGALLRSAIQKATQ